MKKLYLSLLAGALLSIVILGWLIDTFSQPIDDTDSFSWQRTITSGFVKHVAHVPTSERGVYTEQLSAEFNVDISYKSGSTLALPKALTEQMLTEQGLILEDEQGFYLLRSSTALAPDFLEFRLTKPNIQQNNDMLLTLLFYSGVCMFMWFILAPLAKRLNILTNAAKSFASGEFGTRIEVNHFTYIKDVELTFNQMARKIEKLMAENKLMASSLSHDIRTPVACLRFALDAALEEPDHTKTESILLRMEKDLDQMEDMLKSYLSFATLEQKSHLLNFEQTQGTAYFLDIAHQIEPKLEKAKLSLETKIDPDLKVHADLHWLARALTNLLSNACDFAQSTVLLTASQDKHQLIITVEDDGQGIAPENWHKVLSPFFQEENHRNRAGNSYGLGLAIVSKVVDWHHGNIKVSQSELLNGAKFTIYLNGAH